MPPLRLSHGPLVVDAPDQGLKPPKTPNL